MQEIKVDVLVVGAGPAGVTAAIAAGRQGAKVALIERYGVVGGGLTSLYVYPVSGGIINDNIGKEIVKRIDQGTKTMSVIESAKQTLTQMLYEANVRVYLQTLLSGVTVKDDKIIKVTALFHTQTLTFIAKQYIDATGDGDLAYQSGCKIEMGRDGDGLVQPVSLMFTIDGIAPEQNLVCYHEEDYTTLSNGKEYLDLCRKANANGELPKNTNIVRLYDTGNVGERMVNGSQLNHVNALDPSAIFDAEYDLRMQTKIIVDFLRSNVPGFESIRVNGSATTLGVRETRRVMGDYVLTAEDIIAGREFDDAIVHGANFCIDIHNPDGCGQSESEGVPVRAQDYDIPYRCLTPLGKSNLLCAGRCISGTHRAHASYRVMRICMAMGHAAGVAATMALQTDDVRKIDVSRLQAQLDIHE